jgi:hypothetical protein
VPPRRPTRDMLVQSVDRSSYVQTGTDCYCEVEVDDEFHRNRTISQNYDDRPMWRTNDARTLNEAGITSGGEYICHECYLMLRDMLVLSPTSRVTRKRLGLPSKPPRVRRIPA